LQSQENWRNFKKEFGIPDYDDNREITAIMQIAISLYSMLQVDFSSFIIDFIGQLYTVFKEVP